jgi:hypothetical protein
MSISIHIHAIAQAQAPPALAKLASRSKQPIRCSLRVRLACLIACRHPLVSQPTRFPPTTPRSAVNRDACSVCQCVIVPTCAISVDGTTLPYCAALRRVIPHCQLLQLHAHAHKQLSFPHPTARPNALTHPPRTAVGPPSLSPQPCPVL